MAIRFRLYLKGRESMFVYRGQTNNLCLHSLASRPVCISSLPFSGGLTILQLLSQKIPVLICGMSPRNISIPSNFYDKRLIFRNLDGLTNKLAELDHDYASFCNISHELLIRFGEDTRHHHITNYISVLKYQNLTKTFGPICSRDYFLTHPRVLATYILRFVLFMPILITGCIILKFRTIYGT